MLLSLILVVSCSYLWLEMSMKQIIERISKKWYKKCNMYSCWLMIHINYETNSLRVKKTELEKLLSLTRINFTIINETITKKFIN